MNGVTSSSIIRIFSSSLELLKVGETARGRTQPAHPTRTPTDLPLPPSSPHLTHPFIMNKTFYSCGVEHVDTIVIPAKMCPLEAQPTAAALFKAATLLRANGLARSMSSRPRVTRKTTSPPPAGGGRQRSNEPIADKRSRAYTSWTWHRTAKQQQRRRRRQQQCYQRGVILRRSWRAATTARCKKCGGGGGNAGVHASTAEHFARWVGGRAARPKEVAHCDREVAWVGVGTAVQQ